MTPKQKAEELYNIFDMIIYSDQDEHDQCKRCAIRCAEQVINTYDLEGYDEEDSKMEYWQQVKQEISLL
tara:strand:+ start:98 stop:304 length:207 start_codon:yes stop_codon:yes gene_type:complete